MSNSKLVSYTKLSPNHSGKRTMNIDRITPHCVVGQCSVETLGNIFSSVSRKASSNYGIGVDGRVGLYVNENMRSWCSSSNSNDQRAVTIECASDTFSPYAMNDNVYKTLVNLCVDICKRNGKNKLIWIEDKEKALSHEPEKNEMIITVHRWFANKSCPGDWLYSRLGEIAETVTKQLTTDKCVTIEQGNPVIDIEPVNNSLSVGDMVKMSRNCPEYGSSKKFSNWVYSSILYVREIFGNRIVVSTQKTGAITGAVDIKYLRKI